MTDRRSGGGFASRRAFLGSIAAGTVVLAGCLGGETSEGSENTPVRGDPDADVTLEVYEDFICPHCQQYNQQQFPTVQQQYLEDGRIRYEHRDFPFLSDVSWQAVSAVREVFEEHGSEEFWAYKAELMAAGGDLEPSAPGIFGDIANEMGLNGDAIQSAGVDRVHDSAAEADKSRGESLGITGTPSFVVNGELVDGLNQALQTVDSELQ